MVDIIECEEGIGIAIRKSEALAVHEFLVSILRFSITEFDQHKDKIDSETPLEMVGKVALVLYHDLHERLEKNEELREELLDIAHRIDHGEPIDEPDEKKNTMNPMYG